MRIGRFEIHRKEQWDLDCIPWVCVHARSRDGCSVTRIFCVWAWGIEIGARMHAGRQ